MRSLFQLDGPVMRAMSDLTTLVILNLLTIVFCIPIVTAGASLTALHTILMQMFEQREGHVVSGFWTAFKANLRSATPPWLLFAAACAVLYLDYRIFGGGGRAMMIPVYLGVLVLAVIYVWLFPVLARFETTLSGTLRNTLAFAVGYLPRTLLMAALSAAIPFVLTQVTRLLPLAFLFGVSLPSYFSMLVYRPAVQREIDRIEGKGRADETREEGADGEGTAEAGPADEAGKEELKV